VLIILGLRVFYRTMAQGTFYCRRCGGDREYRHRAGRRWFTVFFLPIIPLNQVGEHVQCTTCRTRYVTDVLSQPTTAQMQAALPAGMRAAVSAMLRSGDPSSPVSRQRAIEAVIGSGVPDYDEAMLNADLMQPFEAIRPALNQVGTQLTIQAREWYLTEVIRIAPHPDVSNRLRACVRDVAFIGPVTQLYLDPVALPAHPMQLMVKLPSGVEGPPVTVGQEIEIGWHARDAHVVGC
jgi:hypothetical protein